MSDMDLKAECYALLGRAITTGNVVLAARAGYAFGLAVGARATRATIEHCEVTGYGAAAALKVLARENTTACEFEINWLRKQLGGA